MLCLATSTDLRTWTKHGPMFPDFDTFQPRGHGRPGPWSKAGGILPQPVDGRYLMYFGEGSIWAATSSDLLHWTPLTTDDQPPVMAPRPGTFSDFLVEVGPPPLVTDDGLVLLIHNAAIRNPDGSVRYTAGQLLLDPARPTEILAELTRPWIEPTTPEDLTAWSPTSRSSRHWSGSGTAGWPTTASRTPRSVWRRSARATASRTCAE